MIRDARELNAGEESGAPGAEEFTSANDVMHALVRTAKGLRIYLPNNPVLIKFLEELNAKLARHIALFDTFRLEVEPFALRYQGKDVYENQDPKESIAFRIYSDGIRVLLFSEGVEAQELALFLEVVGFERPNHFDDDIVTQLWEKNLPHISYLLEEDFFAAEWEEEKTAGGSQQEALSRLQAHIAQNSPLPEQMVPKHLLMLTGDEAKWLLEARQAEAQRNPLDDVVNILSAIVAGIKDPVMFEQFLAITGKLTRNMFLSAEMRQALRLVRFLDGLFRLGSIRPNERLLVRAILDGILSERIVQVLQEALDQEKSLSHQELRELLQILGLASIAEMCELLGRVGKMKVRKVIVEVLVELAKDNPEVLAPFLSDPRWYLVRNIVLVLSLVGTPVALEMMVGLVSHREARIRKEVLGFLERSPDPKAKSYLLKFLRDETSALRIRALQILARERLSFALKPALALTTAEDFKGKELAEKKAIYEAIGELGGESVIPLFREMLVKKHWFKKGVDKESAICAVVGLLKMKNAAALKLLQEARGQRNPETAVIIEQAILAIGTGQSKAAAREV